MRTAPPRRRIGAIDGARGLALVGMAVFHTAWDLRYFDLTRLDPSVAPAWRLFGNVIASSFLALSGLGLVLARERGAGWRDALKRIGVVAMAAGAVTTATALVMPGQTIGFGILHCIALGNLVALPLIGAPVWIVLTLAVVAALAPAVLPLLPPAFWWSGLSGVTPDTLDYRPLLPWLCPILVGVVFGRIGGAGILDRASASGPVSRLLGAAGRHSLAVYLIHQPVLFGLLFAVHVMVGTAPPQTASPMTRAEAAAFLRLCRRDCVGRGAQPDLCESTCHCVLTALTEPATTPGVPPPPAAPASLPTLASRCLAPTGGVPASP